MVTQTGGTSDAGAPEPIVGPAFHSSRCAEERALLGYFRLPVDATKHDAQQLRDELAAYAVIERFELIGLFVDCEPGYTTEFRALVTALLRGQANYVVVPSLDHFARIADVQLAMKELLEQHTGARVVVMHRRGART